MSNIESTFAAWPLGSALRDHLSRVVLPLWRETGFNSRLRLPFEAISLDDLRPGTPSRYRAMACARQLFLFSQAGDLAHAETLFASLKHYFYDERNGGWFYSIDAEGAPHERQKDLYTHAFVIFACAEHARHSGSKDALDVLRSTTSVVENRFGKDGAFNAVMSEDFTGVIESLLQNPLMHLTEAWLAARSSTGDVAFDTRLQLLASNIAETFLHEHTGCIAEMPVGTAGNRLEPGHQFEWYFLVFGSQHPAFAAVGLHDALARAFDFAERYGVDPVSGGVCAALDEEGRVIDATQRIWAQTEYLRALATSGGIAPRDHLPAQIERFRQRFLTPRGWIESQTALGQVIRADLPSTTPYHLATAYAALP